MTKYLVLLRAVNVSGKNIIKMNTLKDLLIQNHFADVTTYIQSGNIIVSTLLSKTETSAKIKEIILDNFQLDIEVFVIDDKKLCQVISQNPFIDPSLEPNKIFITFFAPSPEKELIAKLNDINIGKEQLLIEEDVLYFHLPEGMSNSKLSNSFIENKLKVKSTGRNLNTMRKLLDLFYQ